jgi:hypothetical protein
MKKKKTNHLFRMINEIYNIHRLDDLSYLTSKISN